MMTKLMEVAAFAALIAAGAAGAQTRSPDGADALVRGDYAAAEQAILADQGLYSRNPDLLLNLALIYAHTGRAADARRLYREVLVQPEERLDVYPERVVSSHSIAKDGLRRLPVALAAMR